MPIKSVPKTEAPCLDQYDRKRLGRLRERIQYLRGRIAAQPAGEKPPRYFIEEMDALIWATNIIMAHYAQETALEIGAEIKVGDHVIMNCHDRACTRLIARVVRVQGDEVIAEYITKNAQAGLVTGRIGEVLPVERFGVELVWMVGTVSAVRTNRPSEAFYPDGSPRLWQPETIETHALRSSQ